MNRRNDGFGWADIDTGYYSDTKVKALARRVRDPIRTAAWLDLHKSTIIESFRLGRRVTMDDAAPYFWTDLEEARADLIAVGLLDADSMLPAGAWDKWFTGPQERKRGKVWGGTVSGLLAHGMTRPAAEAEATSRLGYSRTPLGSISGDSPDIAGPVQGKSGQVTTGQVTSPRATNGIERTNGQRPLESGECRICGGWTSDKELVRVGPGWIEHAEHPDDYAVTA